MSERRGLLGDLSWVQIVVGALAAMTSAWIASTLGVAGTIIGAAIGSLVIPVSTALYARTLDKGRVLVVKTERGTSERPIEPGDTAVMLQEAAFDPTVTDAEVKEGAPRLRWKAIVITAVVVLALAVAAMGAFELVSGRAYGADPDNARIGNPFSGGSDRTDEPTDSPDDGGDDDATPTPTPSSTPTPTAATPTPTPTPTAPTPTPTPTEPAP